MPDKDPADKPRVIVDEDWKSQVERERAPAPNATDSRARESRELPPATFTMFVSTISIQVLVALGDLPVPGTDKVQLNLQQAKHFIDTLGILEEKTKGNLTKEEERYLTSVLYDLRMRYIDVSSKAQ